MPDATPDLSGLEPDEDKWSIQEYDPLLDDPPADHHFQDDSDPADVEPE